jgi:hypothetical protein
MHKPGPPVEPRLSTLLFFSVPLAAHRYIRSCFWLDRLVRVVVRIGKYLVAIGGQLLPATVITDATEWNAPRVVFPVGLRPAATRAGSVFECHFVLRSSMRSGGRR